MMAATGRDLELTDEDRALGYQSWRLIGDWRVWTKRRVESINYETATSIRRKVSVDLCLKPDVFGEPVVAWGQDGMHYVPVAQLRKQRLVRFDLRDEDDRALPLITKRKNAAIAAAMLSAVSQVAVAGRLEASPITVSDPTAIEIPKAVEQDFWLLAYLDPQPKDAGETSYDVINRYLDAVADIEPPNVTDWTWSMVNGKLKAEASEQQWRAFLGCDPGFADLAFDIARLYFIYAPIRFEPNRRRIVKFSYSEYLGDGQSTLWVGLKEWAVRRNAGKGWNNIEDWLEGLPAATPGLGDEWSPPLNSSESPTVRPRRRFFEALGWTTRVGKFETPAVSHSTSYHLDITTPDGIQIRRAQLVTVDSGGQTNKHPAQRGNRSLRAVDLYTSGKPCRSGNAFVNIRPETSLMVRSAALSSGFIAVLLTLLWLWASKVTADDGKHVDAVAAALVVIPGLLTVLSARDVEHPLTTSMVFGLRVLATAPGILAFIAAGEVLIGHPRSSIGLVLFALAWLDTIALVIAWRLAGRGRPSEKVIR